MQLNRLSHKRPSRSSRILDYVLYIAISLLVVTAIFVMKSAGFGGGGFVKWGGLALYTAVLFGYFIADSRRLFRRWSFWALTATLLSVHLTAFAIILVRIDQWKLIWFMVMCFEVPVLVFFRDRLHCSS